MGRLLTEELANAPLHLIIGSESDRSVAERVLAALRERGMDPPLHVLSCHRSPEAVRKFAREFQGKTVICIGGMSFQLPVILESWFRQFRKHVEVWGIPVGDSFYQIGVATSAMWHLPEPCLVRWVHDNHEACISQVVEEVVAYIRGEKIPEDATEEKWHERVASHHSWQPVIDWKPEKEE